jgi:hypothetical protein
LEALLAVATAFAAVAAMDPPNIDGLAQERASAFNIKKREAGPHAALQHIERTAELDLNLILVNLQMNRYRVNSLRKIVAISQAHFDFEN